MSPERVCGVCRARVPTTTTVGPCSAYCPDCGALLPQPGPPVDAASSPATAPAARPAWPPPDADPPAEPTWCYARGRHKVGPFDWGLLCQLAAAGVLRPDDM